MTTLKVGPAKHFTSGTVEFAKYGNGETAIIINGAEGEKLAVASVNMQGTVDAQGNEAKMPGPKHVWLKGWSENEGIPDALEKAGIVKRTGETFPAGYCEAELAEVLVEIN